MPALLLRGRLSSSFIISPGQEGLVRPHRGRLLPHPCSAVIVRYHLESNNREGTYEPTQDAERRFRPHGQ